MMIGAAVAADYRDFESWRRARVAVCAVLEYAESLSRIGGHRLLAREIDRLSVSILNTLANGFEHHGDKEFVRRALRSVDGLEQKLQTASDRSSLTAVRRQTLLRELRGLRRVLEKEPMNDSD